MNRSRSWRNYILFFFFFYITPTWSQQVIDGLVIQADTGERNLEDKTIKLSGHIQIIFRGQHLMADSVTIFQDKKEIEATGHVLLTSLTSSVGGDKMIMNYETNSSRVYSGYIQAGQVRFTGSLIEKEGDDSYYTMDSHYTSCTTCPPAWSFSGGEIRAKLGGYAFIKNSFLRFGAVPVLWLPYLIVPLKNDRQTGLLTPSFEYSELGGLSISQPFFWAISESQDATIILQNYSLRGTKTRADYRYMLAEDSSGELESGFLRDSYFGQSDRFDNYFSRQLAINRWYFRYGHFWQLPEDWTFRAHLNMASDLQYPIDFPFETQNNGEPAMVNRVSLSKNRDDLHFSIDSSYYYNLLQANPMASNHQAVHRLPEMKLSSTRRTVGTSGFFFNYDLTYTNFYREDFAYDDLVRGTNSIGSQSRQLAHVCGAASIHYDPNWDQDRSCTPQRDGRFDSGIDLIRSGQRLLFEPNFTRPFQIGSSFHFVPSVSYRETQYHFGISEVPDLSRRFLRTKMKLQTSFYRIYDTAETGSSDRYKHEIEPELISTSVPWMNQPQHPFLGFSSATEVPFYSRENASDSDLDGDNGLQFDYDDRLFDRNLLTYRITNKLTKKSWNSKSESSYNRLMTWRISQTYDIYEAQKRENAKPWSDIESILTIRLPYFNTYSKINYFPYQRVTDTSSQVTVNDDHGDYVRVGLTRKYAPSPDGIIDNTKRVEDYMVQVGTTSRYLNFAGRLIYNGNSSQTQIDRSRIKAMTYALILRPPGNCWGIHFVQHRDVTNNDVTYRLNFDFMFDGKTSNVSPTKLLENYGF